LPVNGKPNIDGGACIPTNNCPAEEYKAVEEEGEAVVQKKVAEEEAPTVAGTVGPQLTRRSTQSSRLQERCFAFSVHRMCYDV
jgi:hypothetical protein